MTLFKSRAVSKGLLYASVVIITLSAVLVFMSMMHYAELTLLFTLFLVTARACLSKQGIYMSSTGIVLVVISFLLSPYMDIVPPLLFLIGASIWAWAVITAE